ncbi:MAG TPA: PH domain-containing protein [Anaerolineaceae bacterium]|nr:PH domain-containing protein [Anaerolineaceae bacterium]
MAEKQVFLPPRTTGIALHVLILLVLLAGITLLVIQAFSQPVGWSLILYLLGALALAVLLPIVAYRGYALLHAAYTLERDGLRVRWGLRSEDLPMTEVIWVRQAADLVQPLKLPRFSMPGALLGASHHDELGRVEFIASSAADLVIVSAINKTLILSPQDPEDFTRRFQRVIEMGSLSPIGAHTAVPTAFFNQVFKDRLSRVLIPLGVGLALLLLVATSVMVPFRQMVSLGYDRSGVPLEPVRSSRLLLLPIIGLVFNFFDLITGLFAYRRNETRLIAYLLWGAGILTSVLLLIAVLLLFLV